MNAITHLKAALEAYRERPACLQVLALAVLLTVCSPEEGRSQNRLAAGWPRWQRIEASPLPPAWQVEEASVAFDAWEASAVVAAVSTTDDATTIRFDDGDGGVLDIRLAALPSRLYTPALAEGDSVRISLIRRLGFEGVAQGLVVLDGSGQLLLLYDDGGYGAAFYNDGARAGLSVARSLRGTSSGDDWESADVTFQLQGESVVCAEGDSARLGESGLAVTVVVSREWTGQPVTDADPSPLAYLVFRLR